MLRLSRMKPAASSPERQREDVPTAAASVGGHIVGWADDWEASGAPDPVTRPKLGRGFVASGCHMAALVAAAVDRLGRTVVDCQSTGYKMCDEGKLLVRYGHDGPWELNDATDENRFTMEAWGARMALRAIQRRNRSATVKTRAASRTAQGEIVERFPLCPGGDGRQDRPGGYKREQSEPKGEIELPGVTLGLVIPWRAWSGWRLSCALGGHGWGSDTRRVGLLGGATPTVSYLPTCLCRRQEDALNWGALVCVP
ncbi:recombinase family protein [Streptomyces sp. NPDC048650]|uniref:recombinase family protein n=1 Tax=Streptomyces sp. NPDC048650 TaxID=3365583 RepID=UPI00371F4112